MSIGHFSCQEIPDNVCVRAPAGPRPRTSVAWGTQTRLLSSSMWVASEVSSSNVNPADDRDTLAAMRPPPSYEAVVKVSDIQGHYKPTGVT